MFRIKFSRKSRVSNKLAIVAALTLVITALAGPNETRRPEPVHSLQAASQGSSGPQGAMADSGSAVQPRSGKGFKMSLFLFRHH